MKRNEIKKKIKECLQIFDCTDDKVSETLFNVYPDEMNEICRMFEKEFRKLHQPTVISSSDNTKDDKKDGEWGISKSIFDFVTDL
jgi:hypothetical protein